MDNTEDLVANMKCGFVTAWNEEFRQMRKLSYSLNDVDSVVFLNKLKELESAYQDCLQVLDSVKGSISEFNNEYTNSVS